MAETTIEWTMRPGTKGVTWNPTTGCDKISAGCGLPISKDDDGSDGVGGCYALKLAKRLKGMGSAKYQNDGDPRTSGPGFALTVHPEVLTEPFKWRGPRTVFVNSMSDLFHARVPASFIAQVWAVMAETPQHVYQILTKRPERMARFVGGVLASRPAPLTAEDAETARVLAAAPWPLLNCWLGTSIELDKYAGRADALRATPAAVRFISAEPLLGPLPSLDLTSIDQLIIGGESGPRSRPMDLGWVRELIAMARDAGTAVFVKQLGARWAQDTYVGGQPVYRVDHKGGNWDYWPDDLKIREWPAVDAEAVA